MVGNALCRWSRATAQCFDCNRVPSMQKYSRNGRKEDWGRVLSLTYQSSAWPNRNLGMIDDENPNIGQAGPD